MQYIGASVELDPNERVTVLLTLARRFAEEEVIGAAMLHCRYAIERILRTKNEQINGSIPSANHLWGLVEPIKEHLVTQTKETINSINAQVRGSLHEDEEPEAKKHHVQNLIIQICSVYTDLFQSKINLTVEPSDEILKDSIKDETSAYFVRAGYANIDGTRKPESNRNDSHREYVDVSQSAQKIGLDIEWDSIDEWGLALDAINSKRLKPAEKHLTRALEMFRREDNRLGEGFALGNLGVVALSRGAYQESEKYYQKSIDIMQDLSYKKGLCGAMNSYSILLLEMGKVEEAERLLFQALKIAESDHSCLEERFEILGNIAYRAKQSGENERAKALILETLESIEDYGARGDLVISSLHNLAGIELNIGNLGIAEKLYNRCLEIRGPYPKALMALGQIAAMEGKAELGEQLTLESLRLAEEQGNTLHQAGALSNLSNIVRERDIGKARFYIERSIEISKGLDNPSQEARNLQALGGICQAQRDYVSGIEHYQQSIELLRRLDNPNSLAITLQGLANCYEEENRLEDAEKTVDECLSISKETTDLILKASAYVTKGNIATKRNQNDSALRYFQLALEIYAGLDLHLVAGLGIQLNMGLIEDKRGRVREAEEIFKKIIEVNQTLPEPSQEILSLALANLSNINLRRGDEERANQLMARANHIRRNMGAPDFINDN
jgi:tetratricopeptide (TPR) repeat protein